MKIRKRFHLQPGVEQPPCGKATRFRGSGGISARAVVSSLLAFSAAMLSSCVHHDSAVSRCPPENALLRIENSGTSIGILPDVGGRPVMLKRAGGQNVLKEARSFWNEPREERPLVIPEAKWKPYFGHITWLGPQDDWWKHQTIAPEKQRRASRWPPDPYLIYAPYAVTGHSSSAIELQSPESPVTGIQLTKRLTVDDTGAVVVTVTAQNISRQPRRWNLWSNLRVPVDSAFYVPVSGEDSPSSYHAELNRGPGLPGKYTTVNGYVTLIRQKQPVNTTRGAKLFVTSNAGLIAAFSGKSMLLVTFTATVPDRVPESHAPIEIYTLLAGSDGASFTELEHHAPLHNLAPGESMTRRETWRVVPYDGPHIPEDHTRFLNQYRRNRF